MTGIVLLGRSELLLAAGRHLSDSGHRISSVITDNNNPEHQVGLGDFRSYAEDVGAAFTVVTRRADLDAVRHQLGSTEPTIVVSCNWRYVLDRSFLEQCTAALNFHLGNLPDYKGNATVNWSIIDGLPHIYANVHRMVEDLDAGEVYARRAITLGARTYVGDVLSQATEMVGPLFEEAIQAVQEDRAPLVEATSTGLRCFPRLPDDGLIDWTADAVDIARLIRATSRPFPGAFSHLGQDRVHIWRATPAAGGSQRRAVPGHILGVAPTTAHLVVACGSGDLELEELTVNEVPVSPQSLFRGIRTRFHSGHHTEGSHP